MDIFTMLKANIKHKRGAFVSIIILMTVIFMAVTLILSVNKSSLTSVEDTFEESNDGNIIAIIKDTSFSGELLEKVKRNKMVASVKDVPILMADEYSIGGAKSGSCAFLQKISGELEKWNEDFTDTEIGNFSLKQGEIFISRGLCTMLGCKKGDKVEINMLGGKYEYTVVGIIVEPMLGSSVMGWKKMYVSDSDFEHMSKDAKKAESVEDNMTDITHWLNIYKKADCKYSEDVFKRKLNMETNVVDFAISAITKDKSIYYVSLYNNIIGAVLIAFVLILLVAVFVVIGNSIATGIEMEYETFGILKAMGYTGSKLKLIISLQYIIAETAGILAGILLGIPLIKMGCRFFEPITAIPAEVHIPVLQIVLFAAVIVLVSLAFLFVISGKVSKVSPVKAITGMKNDIYFDKRLRTGISKKFLSLSLAYRQLITNVRHFAGVFVLVIILTFFMSLIHLLGKSITTKSSLEAMGIITPNIYLDTEDRFSENDIKDIESIVEKHSEIESKNYYGTEYLSINGEQLYSLIYKNPEELPGVIEGKAPVFDDEITISDAVSDLLGIKIGDNVTVSFKDKKAEYIVSGIMQCTYDAGENFAISSEGAERIGKGEYFGMNFTLKNPEKAETIKKDISDKYGDKISCEIIEESKGLDNNADMVITAVKVIIYVFSILFTLIVVNMVCKKTFLREKKDIGIYKAIGYQVSSLRVQFSLKFTLVALFSAVIGCVISYVAAGKTLALILREIGFVKFNVCFTPDSFLIPVAVLAVCFFVFSYLASSKIKKVEVKELVVE